jgi:hypothetical protein
MSVAKSLRRSRHWWALILLVLSVIPLSVSAFTVHALNISHSEGRYRVNFDVVLAAAPTHVYAMLADYRKWPHLDDTITESRLLQTLADGTQRVRVIFHSCVLVFCKNVTQTKDLDNHSHRQILTLMVPGQSDFREGRESWVIEAQADKTRMRYDAEFSLAFVIPSIIFKAHLRHKLLVMTQRLEVSHASDTDALPRAK